MKTSQILRIVAGALCIIPAFFAVASIVSTMRYSPAGLWVVGYVLELLVSVFFGVMVIIGQDKLAAAGAFILAVLKILSCFSFIRIFAMFFDTDPTLGVGYVLLAAAHLLLLLAFVLIAIMFLTKKAPSSKAARLGLAIVAAAACVVVLLLVAISYAVMYIQSWMIAVTALIYAVAFVLAGVAASKEAVEAPAVATPGAPAATPLFNTQGPTMPYQQWQPAPQPQPVAPPRFCTNCGHELRPGSSFCAKCGANTALM